ncbi:leucine rich repeat protein-like protein [Phyllosticta citricarpa]
MHASSSSSSKRRSFFGGSLSKSPLSALTPANDCRDRDPSRERHSPNALQKRRRPSSFIDGLGLGSAFGSDSLLAPDSPAHSPAKSPASDSRGPRLRHSARISSWVSARSGSDDPEDDAVLSALSSKTPSVNWGEFNDVGLHSRKIILHGEVQTSSTLFRRKKEYLVLTETHVVRFKNQQKAAETFGEIFAPLHRSSSLKQRHHSNPSIGSIQEFQSFVSDHSGERHIGTPLKQIIAVYQLVDDRPYFAFEICYLEEDSNHDFSMTLQFGSPEDMKTWLAAVRSAAYQIKTQDESHISHQNVRLAARVVEREGDYDPNAFSLFKVVQRPTGRTGSASSSTDDLTKIASTVCFLAVGIHKVHMIPVFKSRQRASSPNLLSYPSEVSFGILTLTSVRLSESDDTFELVFRVPLQKPKVLLMASLAAKEISVRLHHVEHYLRPEWEPRPYIFLVPDAAKKEILNTATFEKIDEASLDRTLCAYCIAYNVTPQVIRYQITYPQDDWPRFELLPPDDRRRPGYTPMELLAVMRALRYNESFGTISFAGIQLDALNELHDRYGTDHVCFKTKRGTPINLSLDELSNSCLLVQEIRALAVTSRKLRRMDFNACIKRKPFHYVDEGKAKDVGCGIVEALFPLCKYQTTNVDWIVLSDIQLGETDLDYLIAAAAEKDCHLRGLELSRCGLDERKMSLVLDALRSQENTLEAIDISRNPARLLPAIFEPQLSVFGYIRILNLANAAHTAGPDPLLTADTLLAWRLQSLNISGTFLNNETIEAITIYLKSSQSESLRELRLDNTGLSGRQIARVMRSMTRRPGVAREMHLDISQNRIELFHDEFTSAIADGAAPAHLTIALIDYEEEHSFTQLVLAIAVNNTIRHLDITKVSLPHDASDRTCQALEKMFAENHTLISIDMSGEDSKLEVARLGVGINHALCGLKRNKTLRVLYIRNQGLGLQGASTLADVLKVNDSLVEVHCENNAIPLQGFTDLVNSLHHNKTLQWLPAMQDGREGALRQTEMTVKNMRAEVRAQQQSKTTSIRNRVAFKIGKAPEPRASPTQMSEQDVRAAVRLVEESWDRQAHRLSLYLQRNMNAAAGLPTSTDVEEEHLERPKNLTRGSPSQSDDAREREVPAVQRGLIESDLTNGTRPSTATTATTSTTVTLRCPDPPRTPSSSERPHLTISHDQQMGSSTSSDGGEGLGLDTDAFLAALAEQLDISREDAQTLLDADAADRLAQLSPVGSMSPVSPVSRSQIPFRIVES